MPRLACPDTCARVCGGWLFGCSWPGARRSASRAPVLDPRCGCQQLPHLRLRGERVHGKCAHIRWWGCWRVSVGCLCAGATSTTEIFTAVTRSEVVDKLGIGIGVERSAGVSWFVSILRCGVHTWAAAGHPLWCDASYAVSQRLAESISVQRGVVLLWAASSRGNVFVAGCVRGWGARSGGERPQVHGAFAALVQLRPSCRVNVVEPLVGA